jgi:serine/threonine protein kinase
MTAFSATFSDFCAGNDALPHLLAVLQEDIQRNRQALFDDAALIESAWRSGRVDREVYQRLRDTITNFDESVPEPGLESGDLPAWSDALAHEVRPGTVLKERFVLEEIIGRGGMGTVYRARDIRREEAQDRYPHVAVKVLNEDFRRHPESFKALQREARKSQILAHPNVASVFDFDRDGPIGYLVMELLDGESLHQFIEDRAGRGTPRAEVWRIVRSAGAALAYAHQKGVVHSDFKPANVIRARDGAIKVLDFGIARVIAHPNAETTRFNVAGLRALTPAYASCEMLLGEEAHPSDDVFALACVTYELLSGRHPFGHLSALVAQKRGLKPIPIDGLDRATWRALAAGLALPRGERTASIETFLAELTPRSHTGLVVLWNVAVLALGAWYYAPELRTLWPSLSAPEPEAGGASKPQQPEIARAEPAAPESPGDEYARQRAAASAAMNGAPPASQPAQREQKRTTERAARTEPAGAASESPSESVVEPPSASAAQSVSGPAPDSPSKDAERRRDAPAPGLSIQQMKQRVIAFARIDEVPDALTALRDVEPRLDPEDDFLQHEAPQAIALAYARVSEREFTRGNYSAALALLDRAHDRAPESTVYVTRREQMHEVAQLEHMLAEGRPSSAEEIERRLLDIRENEGPQYYAIRSRLAEVLARRIERLQASAPEEAGRLLELGQNVFAGASAIDALAPVDGVTEENGAGRPVGEEAQENTSLR